jgi:hypothetical protein
MRPHSIIALALAGGAIAGIISSFIITNATPSRASLFREFYAVENAVHVSPHSIRKGIQEGKSDFILVDLRSAEEYEKEQIQNRYRH